MSIGWNPYYANTQKSMETHILHNYGEDLYGRNLRVIIVGYLRPEANFDGLDSLITAIRNDISNAEEILNNSTEKSNYKNHEFFFS